MTRTFWRTEAFRRRRDALYAVSTAALLRPLHQCAAPWRMNSPQREAPSRPEATLHLPARTGRLRAFRSCGFNCRFPAVLYKPSYLGNTFTATSATNSQPGPAHQSANQLRRPGQAGMNNCTGRRALQRRALNESPCWTSSTASPAVSARDLYTLDNRAGNPTVNA
jgi:hypothetical protein